MIRTNREWAALFGVLQVGWVLLLNTIGYASVPASWIWLDFLIVLAIVVFTPLVISQDRCIGALITGAIRIVEEIVALLLAPASSQYGAVVALVLAMLFTYFSYRAWYRPKQ